jgi:hypothetical protein
MQRSLSKSPWWRFPLIAAVTAVIPLMLGVVPRADAGGKGYAKFNEGGELMRPEGYRQWIYVGAPLTPNDMNKGKAPFPEFHSVYIDPESYKEYEKSGKFRDGTILVKELVSVGSKGAASGNGYFMGEFVGLEATVKDSKRFKDEPGYWAYFSFTEPKGAKTAKAFPASACNGCHDGAAAEDWVFTQYYPVLRAAKP